MDHSRGRSSADSRAISSALGVTRVATIFLAANPGRLIVFLAGAVSVALAASGILLAASTSLATVRQTVDAGWRGTYDILVRPADAPSVEASGHELVPLDYLGLRTSGITREQWQRIAQLPGVEVAAPVAALGWLKDTSPSIGVELASHAPGVAYEVGVSATIAGQDALRVNGLIAFRDDRNEADVGFRDYSGPDPVVLSLGDLPATWGLVVGIDPAAEDALIGLRGYVQGRYLSSGASQVFDGVFGRPAVAVPVLTAERTAVPGNVSVTISAVDGLTPDEIDELNRLGGNRDVLEAAIERAVAAHTVTRISGDDVPLAAVLSPLRSGGIYFGPDGRLTATRELRGGATAVDDNVVLVPSLAGYEPTEDPASDLVLSGQGTWQELIDPQLAAARPPGWRAPSATFGGDATVYRDLDVTVPPPFMLTPLGTYDREAIDAHYGSAANDAPLGIYASIPRQIVGAADPLPISINPAGLNPAPPIGLTNLEVVEALRGAHFIDAIRVRVRGIDGYTPEGVRRIEDVARRIVDATGLEVDVIAGSSPVDIRVAVPGVGVMSERWTTLGNAAEIVSGAQGLSALLLAAAALVVAAYLAVFSLFLTTDQAAQIGMLRRLGWRRRSLVWLIGSQALLIGLVAAGLTVALVAALATAAGQYVSEAALALTAIVVLLVHPVVAAAASFLGLRRRSAKRGLDQRPRSPVSHRGLIGLALTFLSEAPGRTIVGAAATALALIVAGAVAAIELAAGGELRASVFGSVVAVRLAPYHLLAAAAALFAAGALILDGALLTVERRLPLIGTLRAVGWRSGAIRGLVTLESALPALAAGLAASVVVAAISWWLNLGWMSLGLAIGVLILAVVLATVATQLPAGVAARATPAASLRSEGASTMVGGFAPGQALLSVTAIAVTVALVAGGWSAAAAAAGRPLPFVPPTEHPLSPVAARIQADVTSLAADVDRQPGSDSLDQAMSYMAKELTAAGYGVESHSYPSPVAAYFDANGNPVDATDVLKAAVAYDAAAWDDQGIDLPATLADARDGELPTTCATGVSILRIADAGMALLAEQLEQRCLGTTAAVLAVRLANDSAWDTLTHAIARVRLSAARYLTASSPAVSADSHAPWLITTLDSHGPGATESAAPAAVILAIARRASSEGIAVRVGVVSVADEAAGSVFLEQVGSLADSPIIWLGPMGGIAAPVLGTVSLSGIDRSAATAGLLWISSVDSSFSSWALRAASPKSEPTSADLLGSLSRTTGIQPSAEVGLNISALTVGLDAAWLGESTTPLPGSESVAGTTVDTPSQIHPSDLEQISSAIFAALGSLQR